MTNALQTALALTPPDRDFAEALDSSFRTMASDVAQVGDDMVLGTVALALELLGDGKTIGASEFLQLNDEVRKEFALTRPTSGSDALVKALTRVASRLRGEVVVPLTSEG